MLPDCTRRAGSYWSKCVCADCRRDRARKRAHHYGGLTWRVPQDVAWAVLAAKIDDGWTARALGSATNLGPDYFDRHVAQHRKGNEVLLGPNIAAIIMRMGTPTEGQVGAESSRRRLRALAAVGHGLNTLTIETGLGFSTLAAIRSSRAVRVGAQRARVIAEVYDRLHMTVGGDAQAIQQARSKGWPSPLAWNDIDADRKPPKVETAGDWNDLIDDAVVQRVIDSGTKPRRLTRAEGAEIARVLLSRGLSTHQIERNYGINTARYRQEGSAA